MDAIKLYLKDIKNIPLLTAEEELDLAYKIKKGSKPARAKMIRSNLRLVINIAKRYSYLGVPMMDLIEEGNLGLMKGVEKYNPKRGYRFSTYAAWWIRQYITRAIANQGKTIRVPVYMVESAMRFKKISEQLQLELKRRPRLGEIARRMKLSLKRVRQLDKMAAKISSLNAPIGEEGTAEFMDLIEDENTSTAADELVDFLKKEKVGELLKQMSPRERKILTLRFGLKEGITRTLGYTAKRFNITRERVRQIEFAAMKKLRAYLKQQELSSIQGTLTPFLKEKV
ncbi:MAG: sigma-70 family RNA polymerase sigma factor [Candidatus Omnitrophica bacterium]|nr:sigma-70 family RNA polymerase sigma factor [Candidatus Omnitrophota bacterium]MBU4488741.1 sigma-70 family RNA polymerase sigma factor [Candidatus Omnitrophota bacterium]MCG2705838.1 sigma-70 family RNA polymerase sigma factor [Candidatus Omnitrophota bacterium]